MKLSQQDIQDLIDEHMENSISLRSAVHTVLTLDTNEDMLPEFPIRIYHNDEMAVITSPDEYIIQKKPSAA